MKLLKKLTLLLVLSPVLALASMNLAEPDALLKKAGENRTALRDVILDLELNIPEMRDPATFDKYFALLDELTALSNSTGLETYYPDIVKNLGLNMVANGIRWLDVTKDSSEKLAYYIQWMDAETLARFLSLVEYQMSVVKDVPRLTTMANSLEAVLPMIDAKSTKLPYVQLGFRRLISDVAVALLKTDALPEDQVAFWLKKIKVSSSFSEYLDFLTQKVYALDRDSKTNGHIYIARLSQMMVQSGNLAEVVPNWLMNAIGDSTSELILRMVRFEEPFAPAEFESALNLLKTRNIQGIAQQWMAQEKLPSQNYVEHYLGLSRILIKRADALGLEKEANDLKKWLGRAAAPVIAQKLDLEGNYKMTDAKGGVWFFTIAKAKDNMLIAALSDAGGLLYKTFYNVSYNLVDDSFVASQREPDIDNDQNPPIKFWMDGKGGVKVEDPLVRVGPSIFKGKKVQSFPDLWKTTVPNAPTSADGTYEGDMILPTGAKMKARLMITTFNGYTLGRMDTEGVALDLNVGSQGNDGVVILTTGRNLTASWFQLRANITATGLKAYVIIGGKGLGTSSFFLKKVK